AHESAFRARYHRAERAKNVEIRAGRNRGVRLPSMRTLPKIGDVHSETDLPYPVETLRYWYVSPFGGCSKDLARDQVGVDGAALARNTELTPDDRIAVALPGQDPERPWFFQDTFEVVALDASHTAADLSPRG